MDRSPVQRTADDADDDPPANPFATRWIRPGAQPYHFAAGEGSAPSSLDRLALQLADQQGWGQIVGPHGAGKSTLLHGLVAKLRTTGWSVIWHRLVPAQRRLPRDPLAGAEPRGGRPLIVVDGYQQLAWWHARRLRRACQRQGAGLLVTTHRELRLPLLWRCAPTIDEAQRLAAHLQRAAPPLVDPSDVAAAHDRAAGNLRETLFLLYDLYERRRRTMAADAGPAASAPHHCLRHDPTPPLPCDTLPHPY